ncbi:MAG: C69 family dipeptidase [Chitinivibrionales bacterium]|nr:C69 family dipeptidase [Chitinivibrionales bacterium]
MKQKKTFFIVVGILVFVLFQPILSAEKCGQCSILGKCTSALFGKNATADNSVIFAHQEDYGDNDCMHVVYHPRQTHTDGEIIDFSYVDIAQVPVTFSYTSDDMYDPSRLGFPGPASFMNGINEYGVSMSSNCFESKESFPPLAGGLSWSEIGQLCMERCTTARHAVELSTWLVSAYHFNGFEASACKNLTFMIADAQEGWIVETTSRHWVAKKCPEDSAIFYANEAQIETEWDLASPQLIDYAVQQGWYDPTSGVPFNFKQVYCAPFLGYRMNTIRQERMVTLLAPKLGSITIQDCFAFWRDHHEGTSDYYLPHTVPTTSWFNPNMQYPVCAAWTHASEIYHLRSSMPTAVGSVMWICPSSPCCGIYTPIYAGNKGATPESWTLGTDAITPGSAWWTFEQIQRTVAGYENSTENWQMKWQTVRTAFDKREAKQFSQMPRLEQKVLKMFQYGKNEKAYNLLTSYSHKCLQKNYSKAHALLNEVQ